LQIYAFILNGANNNRKNCLSSESQRLQLLGEMEVFGHFGDERVGFDAVEIEDGGGIDPIVK
jgi:hypothetical protein